MKFLKIGVSAFIFVVSVQVGAASAQIIDGTNHAPVGSSALSVVISRCKLPEGVQITEQLADVPSTITKTLSMGPADGPIKTDAGLPNDTRPELRFQMGVHLGNAWVILYQSSGIATTMWANSYRIGADGASAISSSDPQNVMGRSCPAVIAGLARG